MDASYTLAYEEYELKHWWHVARRELIHRCLDRFVPEPAKTRWLDIGCGTGVLLRSYPRIADRLGLEVDGTSVQRGREQGLDIRQTGTTWDLTPYGQFDLITLCDVLEHVPDERTALAAVHQSLKPGGLALVTVPALKSLWSAHDVRNHHYRRYVKRELAALFSGPEWQTLKISYFCATLLPGIWSIRQCKRLLHGTDPARVSDDKKLGPRWLDAMLLRLLRLEYRCLWTLPMPLGSSLLAILRRK